MLFVLNLVTKSFLPAAGAAASAIGGYVVFKPLKKFLFNTSKDSIFRGVSETDNKDCGAIKDAVSGAIKDNYSSFTSDISLRGGRVQDTTEGLLSFVSSTVDALGGWSSIFALFGLAYVSYKVYKICSYTENSLSYLASAINPRDYWNSRGFWSSGEEEASKLILDELRSLSDRVDLISSKLISIEGRVRDLPFNTTSCLLGDGINGPLNKTFTALQEANIGVIKEASVAACKTQYDLLNKLNKKLKGEIRGNMKELRTHFESLKEANPGLVQEISKSEALISDKISVLEGNFENKLDNLKAYVEKSSSVVQDSIDNLNNFVVENTVREEESVSDLPYNLSTPRGNAINDLNRPALDDDDNCSSLLDSVRLDNIIENRILEATPAIQNIQIASHINRVNIMAEESRIRSLGEITDMLVKGAVAVSSGGVSEMDALKSFIETSVREIREQSTFHRRAHLASEDTGSGLSLPQGGLSSFSRKLMEFRVAPMDNNGTIKVSSCSDSGDDMFKSRSIPKKASIVTTGCLNQALDYAYDKSIRGTKYSDTNDS